MNYRTMLGKAGSSVDQWLVEWRIKGVRGSERERERFREEQFHGARGMIRLAVEAKVFADPELHRSEVLESSMDEFLGFSAEQAEETGFDEVETAFYVGITRSACASLLEEYRAHGV